MITRQILSRAKPALGGETQVSIGDKKKKNKAKVPTLEEYLQQRDYLGALTLLEVSYTMCDASFNIIHDFNGIT